MPTYSRDYRPNDGDTLDRIDTDPEVVCKTSFEAEELRDFLETLNGVSYIRIVVDEWSDDPIHNIFSIEAYNASNQMLDSLEGTFPCPDQCIPPETQIIEPDNTFAISDVNEVLAYIGITYFNVHSAIRIENTLLRETHCIYPVKGYKPTWTSHYGPNDPAFISTFQI